MDTTSEYILLCEKAVMIQEIWEPKIGDFCKPSNFNSPQVISEIDGDYIEFGNNGNCNKQMSIWLPKQSDLQGIILKNPKRNIIKKLVKEEDEHDSEFSDRKNEEINRVKYSVYTLVSDFNYFVNSNRLTHAIAKLNSMKQLWLAFVMNEKFNKVWDSVREEWINV